MLATVRYSEIFCDILCLQDIPFSMLMTLVSNHLVAVPRQLEGQSSSARIATVNRTGCADFVDGLGVLLAVTRRIRHKPDL
eukprot:SAG31_NODE_1494_length_8106_cov_7.933183_5_plen_81_part_00